MSRVTKFNVHSTADEASHSDQLCFLPTVVTEALATEILGKNVLVNGATLGSLGAEVVGSIAKYANLIILGGRTPSKIDETIKWIKESTPSANVHPLVFDLSSLDGARKGAVEALALNEPIHVLINSAAVMAVPYSKTVDGLESHMAINHFGPFLFTMLLFPLLARSGTPSFPARIVNVSSAGYRMSPIRFDDLEFQDGKVYDRWGAYAQSKTANILTANELARRSKEKGLNVVAYSLHPGNIFTTNLAPHLNVADFVGLGAMNEKGEIIVPHKTSQQGAATYIVAAFDPSVVPYSGAYLEDADIADRADHAKSQLERFPWVLGCISSCNLDAAAFCELAVSDWNPIFYKISSSEHSSMPDVRITNETSQPLNIALSQIAPLHFSNQVLPGNIYIPSLRIILSMLIKHCRSFIPGRSVWFTVEWRVDNVPQRALTLDGRTLKRVLAHSNRYSAAKSAKTIGVVSAAGLSLVALAGPAALTAAAAAGSTTAASLLASSATLTAASTAEAIAFSSYAATTLTATALEAISEDTGLPPEKSSKIQTSLNALSTAISAGSVGGVAALKGTRKAALSAGTTLVTKLAARRTKKENAEANKVINEHLSPAGKTERVYGVFIGFRTRNFAIREVTTDKGEVRTELWDTDANKRLS
ncbi:NAD(P)-binding protein [Clavulina sp. PMI_390]|nr:NAD(P)-binding protein [Clavulina sp. PMI_390]